MQGTREHILEFIVRHREARVEDLADEFQITTAAIRRHLDHLRADGLIDLRAVKQPTGRPYYAYFATAEATQPMPQAYADLLESMLRSVGEREEVIAGVMTSVAESMADRHRPDPRTSLPDSDPEHLVGRVTASLREEGILESWRSEADGFHLVNHACPYIKAASISKLPCESDRKAIELLLGLDVEQLNRIVDGSPICEYLVHAARSGQTDLIQVEEGIR
jgi:predicted ArsR family transcriptional regulator